jgi:two-component system, cell cycle sensor histidine kinase and response regulator CckA
MSTTQKLLSGFGILTAVLIVTLVAIILDVQELEKELEEMSLARDRSATARELEINALDYALGVLDYVESGEDFHKPLARYSASRVEEHMRAYKLLSLSSGDLDQSTRFDSLWYELKHAGDMLLVQPPARSFTPTIRKFQSYRVQLERLLDEKVQHEAVEEYEIHKAEVLRHVSNALTLALSLLAFGLVTAAITSFVVVREIVKAESLSRDRGEELRVALLSIDDAVMTVDRSGRIVLFNKMAESLTGWTSDEAKGKMLEEICRLYDGETLGRAGNPIHQVLSAGGTIKSTTPLLLEARDGTKKPVENTTSPIRNSRGHVVSAVAYFRDLTERNKLQAQLLHAHKMDAVGRLAGGIAHDFNNILGIILGHSTLLEQGLTHADGRLASIEKITSAAQRGTALVSQLLTFARKSEPVRGSVRINDIIREIEKLALETFPKTITLSTMLEEQLPSVVADATQVHQVLLNLCVNARDAMPRGGMLSVATRTARSDALAGIRRTGDRKPARSYVEIEVCDTGVGMDEATLNRIFEPFYTTKGVGQGTGLGLSLVFGIVENHNGFVAVESTIGKGSCFRIYFPIAEVVPQAAGHERKIMGDVPGGTETLLLIEDEEMLRELTKTALMAKGYTVITAENGEEGIELYCRHRPRISLVLTDFGLPKVGGEEVVKRIRTIDPASKLIVASGFIDPVMRTRLYKEGARHIVQKPYMADELLQIIRSVIDGKR